MENLYSLEEVNHKIKSYSRVLNSLKLELFDRLDKEEIKRVSELLKFWENYKIKNF